MRLTLRMLGLFGLGGLLANCGGASVETAPVCAAGVEQQCTCEDKSEGLKTCEDDGSAFGECVCSVEEGTESDTETAGGGGGGKPGEEGGTSDAEAGGEEGSVEDGGETVEFLTCSTDCMNIVDPVEQTLCALDLCESHAVISAWFSSPTDSDWTPGARVTEHFGDAANYLNPKNGGSYALLATGDVAANPHSVGLPGGGAGTDPFGAASEPIFDAVEFNVEMVVPEGVAGFRLDYIFMST